LLLAAVGCDQGHQDDEPVAGPFVRVVGTNFDRGQTIPANGSVQISFDRVLDPASVNRQAAIVLEASGRPVTNPIVSFDPVTRVLSLSGPNQLGTQWLIPGQPYILFLSHPDDPDSVGGVRAIDGTPLERGSKRQLSFFASANETSDAARGFDPNVEFCRDVLPLFRSRCASNGCHQAPDPSVPVRSTPPASSLLLETPSGVANTALHRAAQGANTGPRAGVGNAPGRVFGVDMPIIEPGNPGASWLMYKLLIAPPPRANEVHPPSLQARCDDSAGPAPIAVRTPLAPFAALADEERARLSDAVLGLPMPYPPQPGADDRSQNLTFEEIERIRIWIAQGATVNECGACLP
jgi:hypothetical protein